MSKEREKRTARYADAKQIAQKQQQGFSSPAIRLPKGVSNFRFSKEGKYRLYVLPFEAKKGNPNADAGFFTWERTFHVHPGLGPEGRDSHCCLSQTFGKPCAVHDKAKGMERDGVDSELVKTVRKTSKRQMIAVYDLDDKEKGVQIYEGSYYKGFGELIDNKIDASEEDSVHRKFFHLTGGSKLIVKVNKVAFKTETGGGSFFQPVNLEMEPRADLGEEWLDLVPCLDDLVVELSYQKLQELVNQDQEDDDDEESSNSSSSEETAPPKKALVTDEEGPAPAPKKPKPPVDEDTAPPKKVVPVIEDNEAPMPKKPKPATEEVPAVKKPAANVNPYKVTDMVRHAEFGDCEIIRISSEGLMILEDDNQETHRGVEAADVEPIKPKKAEEVAAPVAKKPVVEDEAPPTPKKPSKPRIPDDED